MIQLSLKDICQFGISQDTVKELCKRYRQGKSPSWSNIKDPNDRRKVLIDLESIPDRTREKYNIPTSDEYTAQQLQAIRDQQIFKDKTHEEVIANMQNEVYEECRTKLINAYNLDHYQFYPRYMKRYSEYLTSDEASKRSELRARQEAFWLKLVELSGGPDKVYRGFITKLWKVLLSLPPEINYGRKPNTKHYFGVKLKACKKALKKYGTVMSVICAKNEIKGGVAQKTTNIHKAIAFSIMSHGSKYSFRLATEVMNNFLEENDLPTISVSWLKDLLIRDNTFKTIVQFNRNGKKFAMDNILPYSSRQGVLYPGNVWMIDGTPIQFYCWNKSRTKRVRLNLFLVVDVCTKHIVGFDVSYSENRWNVLKSLKMAVNMVGHLPQEIVSDNFSAAKTDEIKALKEQFKELGVHWRHAKVGNAADKSQVERLIGTLQSEFFRLYGGFIGEGIMSKRDNRPSVEYIQDYYKKHGYLTYNQMAMRLAKVVSQHNEGLLKNGKSPIEKYKEFPKPNVKELTADRIALLFWNETKHTVKRGMIHITVEKIKYIYTIYDHDVKAEYQGKQVIVRYDEKDLSEVMIFDTNNQFLCLVTQDVKVNMNQAERTETEDLEIIKSVSHKESYEKYLQRKSQKITDEGLEDLGCDTVEITHPLAMEKLQTNTIESNNMLEYFMMENDYTEADFESIPKVLTEMKHSKVKSYTELVTEKVKEKSSCEPIGNVTED